MTRPTITVKVVKVSTVDISTATNICITTLAGNRAAMHILIRS
jgi:hypothetical protein